jgi:hypothetical protein
LAIRVDSCLPGLGMGVPKFASSGNNLTLKSLCINNFDQTVPPAAP